MESGHAVCTPQCAFFLAGVFLRFIHVACLGRFPLIIGHLRSALLCARTASRRTVHLLLNAGAVPTPLWVSESRGCERS